jgi:hypothetical protein
LFGVQEVQQWILSQKIRCLDKFHVFFSVSHKSNSEIDKNLFFAHSAQISIGSESAVRSPTTLQAPKNIPERNCLLQTAELTKHRIHQRLDESNRCPCPAEPGRVSSSQKRPQSLQSNLQLKVAAAWTQAAGILKDVSVHKTNIYSYYGTTNMRSTEQSMQMET